MNASILLFRVAKATGKNKEWIAGKEILAQ
jgi:hypothetical protein